MVAVLKETWAGVLHMYQFGKPIPLTGRAWFQTEFGRVAFLGYPGSVLLDIDAQELAEHVTLHNARAAQ